MNKLFILATLMILLTGCAPSSIQRLRENSPEIIVFETEQNYQPAYRTILENMRRCHQGMIGLATVTVQGDIYNDIQSGSIAAALGGNSYLLAADINAINETRTKVAVYYYNKFWKPKAIVVEAWVNNGYSECNKNNISSE